MQHSITDDLSGLKGVKPISGLGMIHGIVLSCALALTIMAWQFAEGQLRTQSLEHFERSMLQTVDVLRERMEKYDEALRAGVAVLRMADNDVSAGQWRTFAQNLRIEERYPGINGIGMIYQVSNDQLPEFISGHRLHQPSFQPHNTGDRPEHYIITYIEPLEDNREALGLDIGFEENRRDALLRAAATGQTTMTGPIVLVQDETATAGFLLLAPYYGDSAGSEPVFLGAAYAPFVMHRLIDGVLGQSRRNTMMRIADGPEIIYDEIDPDDPLYDAEPVHVGVLAMPLFGRNWQVTFQSNLAFRGAHGVRQPTVILICGLLVDFSLLVLFVSLSQTKARAHDYARKLTLALHTDKQELEASNAALERYARISSHDLRTPLRAMRDLTDYLTEDLSEIHPAASEDPKFQENINSINEMIDRMDNLIVGMLAYSQLGHSKSQIGCFGSRGEIDRIVAQLGEAGGGVSLRGEFPELRCDKSLFDLIVTHLARNALQHHDTPRQAEVIIGGQISGASFVLTVRDDGPGIDPRYHERIFDMFQTLHHHGLPHNTGLGLAIVKRAVTLIGGHVTVSSGPERGCLFTVMLHGIVQHTETDGRKAA